MKKFLMPGTKLKMMKKLIDSRVSTGDKFVVDEVKKLLTYNKDNWDKLSDIVRAK